MSDRKIKIAVLFGGAGFIGQHFSRFLLECSLFDKVVLVDNTELIQRFDLSRYLEGGSLEFLYSDVREAIKLDLAGEVGLICNFAAVHREPGHINEEYYETNLPGAKNVCDWAEKVSCNNIIFTSSIAPYGPTESPKTEESVPTPVRGYGGSKLAAEKIHQIWHARQAHMRRLVIVRPGVVFGAGEMGNVSRLICAVNKRYFFYMGNKHTRKAGTYVKELCNAMYWVLCKEKAGVETFNMSMNPGPTVEEYVNMICKVSNIKRSIFNIPFWVLFPISLVIDPVCRVLAINQPISPMRLKKLVKSNNIVPQRLAQMGYEYQYSFEEAMRDWKVESPKEWLK